MNIHFLILLFTFFSINIKLKLYLYLELNIKSKVILILFSLIKKDTLKFSFNIKQSKIILKISFLQNGKFISLKSILFSYV
jgi:hypothetical protein